MHPNPLIVSTACLALLLNGCAHSPANVVFMTKSSLGVDVEASTQTASVAYDRTEGYSRRVTPIRSRPRSSRAWRPTVR